MPEHRARVLFEQSTAARSALSPLGVDALQQRVTGTVGFRLRSASSRGAGTRQDGLAGQRMHAGRHASGALVSATGVARRAAGH